MGAALAPRHATLRELIAGRRFSLCGPPRARYHASVAGHPPGPTGVPTIASGRASAMTRGAASGPAGQVPTSASGTANGNIVRGPA